MPDRRFQGETYIAPVEAEEDVTIPDDCAPIGEITGFKPIENRETTEAQEMGTLKDGIAELNAEIQRLREYAEHIKTVQEKFNQADEANRAAYDLIQKDLLEEKLQKLADKEKTLKMLEELHPDTNIEEVNN